MVKVLFCCKYERTGASSRLRILQYLPYLARDISYSTNTLLDNRYVANYNSNTRYSRWFVCFRYFMRFFKVLFSNADIVVIEKELFPYIPYVFEKICLLKKKFIIDIDDAVFLAYNCIAKKPIISQCLSKKFHYLFSQSYAVLAGSPYLVDYAAMCGAKRVFYFPTVIDTSKYYASAPRNENTVTIGWIGSPSSVKYLQQIVSVLDKVAIVHKIQLLVVGGKLSINPRNINVIYAEWLEQTEVGLINQMDIGIMPLDSTPWEMGKCGYKLIQYMGCGKPVVASNIGANKVIVDENCGYLCDTLDQWFDAIIKLVENSALRVFMGNCGLHRVKAKYSINSNIQFLNSLLRDKCYI